MFIVHAGILHSSMPEDISSMEKMCNASMAEGQNVPIPTGGFFLPITTIFQRKASMGLAFVTV
jgi:hypothetical protein